MSESTARYVVRNQYIPNCRSHLESVGNWCGHTPLTPRFFEPNSEHKRRPDVIQWAIKKLNVFYYEPMRWLCSLMKARSSLRQERSEGRERDADVIGVLLHYTELASLRVGVPLDNGTFLNLDMKFIAKKLGWRSDKDDIEDRERIKVGRSPLNKGVKRVWRSIEALKRAGYIEVHERCQKKEGRDTGYQGLAAVKRIFPKLFHELGINELRLNHRRRQAQKRVQKKQLAYKEKLTEELIEKNKGALQGVLDFTLAITGKVKMYKRAPTDHFLRLEKQRQERCYKFKQIKENRNLSSDEFYAKYPELNRDEWHQRE